jgi:hypothetical protein
VRLGTLVGTEFAVLLARAGVSQAEFARVSWHETLGVPPNADADTGSKRHGQARPRYHPDKGGTQAQMARIQWSL